MSADRRTFLTGSTAAIVGAAVGTSAPGIALAHKDSGMYGLVGVMTAKPGQRDALTALLLEGLNEMPGCLSYIVAHDPGEADAVWITEVWDRKESHNASLALPAVKATITKARPLIAGMKTIATTEPVGGQGLSGNLHRKTE